MFTADKVARGEAQKALKDHFFTAFAAEVELEKVSKVFLGYIFDKVLNAKITELCFVENKRVDSRAFDQVRAITSEVGLLPYAHGSALFTRGRTQALVSVTLGSGQDELKTDRLMGETLESAFMLQYNFPPFSVGEARQQRGPGRREVGHGHLAASAIQQVLPPKNNLRTRCVLLLICLNQMVQLLWQPFVGQHCPYGCGCSYQGDGQWRCYGLATLIKR